MRSVCSSDPVNIWSSNTLSVVGNVWRDRPRIRDAGDIQAMRDAEVHFLATFDWTRGGKSLPQEEPTANQLGALVGILKEDGAPCTDVAV
mgnify:CR=1 FL=1